MSTLSTTVPIINLKNVSVTSEDENRILAGMNLEINPGEILGIYGSGGCGKTTLGYVISGIIPKFLSYELEGEVKYRGKDMKKIDPHDVGKHVGIVFQNPDYQIFFNTVYREVGFPVGYKDEKVERIMESIGIDYLKERNSDTLSYGEKKLVLLASNCGLEPDIIILDEVFSSLDRVHTEKITDYLKKLKENGKSVVIIENEKRKIPFLTREYSLSGDLRNGS